MHVSLFYTIYNKYQLRYVSSTFNYFKDMLRLVMLEIVLTMDEDIMFYLLHALNFGSEQHTHN